ncbi:MAG: hypothetical protein WBA63_09245 [Thermomicrobiales bacterium]
MIGSFPRKQDEEGSTRATRRQPWHLMAGVALVAVAWPLAWFGPAPFSEYTFFPLWLGYILTVDGLTALRTGTSLLTRDGRRFALLFVFSLPLWWLFEFANHFLGNWRYVQATHYSTAVYAALASLAFSTVMPAVFVTAELYRSAGCFGAARNWIRIAPSRSRQIAIAALGLAMFVASIVFPHVAFPLVWIGVFLLLDPLNALTGGGSITAQVAVGRWDTVLVLFAAGLTCGFFWEMWNVWSLPKWVYDVPYVGQPKLFEMPLLGYGGYLPFALEIYAFYQLLHTLIFRRRDSFLRFDQPS